MNLIEQYGKKKVLILVGGAITLAILAGIGVWYVNEQNHKDEVLTSIDLTFKEDVFIEYGQEKVDYNEYIKEKVGEPDVTMPTVEIDTKTITKHEVIYKVVKEGYSKDANLTLEVKDTKAPEINIKEETITLEYGSEYDIKENIESVKDPIDGDIPYAETAGENNYYIVEGTVDTATSGDYTITIKAVDKNKTESEKTYTVHVNEEQEETPTPQQTNGGSSYTPPVNNGGVSYTPPSNIGGGSPTPPSNVCVSNNSYTPLGNSGKIFNDKGSAAAWADAEASNSNSPWYGMGNFSWTVEDNCGNEKWTVDFY